MRHSLLFLCCLLVAVVGRAQETDTTKVIDTALVDTLANKVSKPDSAIMVTVTDTLVQAQDTVKKETRKERKEREREEAEREKYYYKGIKKDSTRLEIEWLSKVAWKRSLMVPAWGQYTNKGLWWVKVPVIYGGFVGAYLVFDYWQWYYKKFLTELDIRIANDDERDRDPDLINWTTEGLVRQKDYARRNRDLTILVTVGWWGLNVVEAYVDSMLKYRWDIGSQMSMKVTPTFVPSQGYASNGFLRGYGVTPGVKLTMSLY